MVFPPHFWRLIMGTLPTFIEALWALKYVVSGKVKPLREDKGTAMEEARAVRDGQRAWATENGVPFDSRGYVDDVEMNLRTPLSAAAQEAYERGARSELARHMRALHSSSALVVNLFDYWSCRDKDPLLSALGISGKVADRLEFEARFPTGLGGTPPHLDVVIWLSSGEAIAVESKFTEHLVRSTKGKSCFEPSYFPEQRGLWEEKGMPASQLFAEELNAGLHRFEFLDPWQLLKHALGLANILGQAFRLVYLYYDSPGERAQQHWREVQRFADAVRDGFIFEPVAYQTVYQHLTTFEDTDLGYLDYIDYLGTRYFPDVLRR